MLILGDGDRPCTSCRIAAATGASLVCRHEEVRATPPRSRPRPTVRVVLVFAVAALTAGCGTAVIRVDYAPPTGAVSRSELPRDLTRVAIEVASVQDRRANKDAPLGGVPCCPTFTDRPPTEIFQEALRAEVGRLGFRTNGSGSPGLRLIAVLKEFLLKVVVRKDGRQDGVGLFGWWFSSVQIDVALHADSDGVPIWAGVLKGTAQQKRNTASPGGDSSAPDTLGEALSVAVAQLGWQPGFAQALARFLDVPSGPPVAVAGARPRMTTTPAIPAGREGRAAAPGEPDWRSAGSGFVLRGTSHILTSLHVVEQARTIRVSFPSGERYTGRVVARDTNNDLAVVQLQGMPARGEGFAVALGARVEVGEEVHALGSPLGGSLSRSPSIVSGQVNAATGPRDNVAQFRMTTPINAGNSGGQC